MSMMGDAGLVMRCWCGFGRSVHDPAGRHERSCSNGLNGLPLVKAVSASIFATPVMSAIMGP